MPERALSVVFHGAAGMVTGACFRVDGGARPFLIDCGLVQGPKTLQGLNTRPFPFSPGALGAVVLTHAHIDHSGLLPRLVAAGFRGPIHATPATCDLLRWLLMDAAAIQEAEAERFDKRARKRGQTAERAPLYTREDAAAALERLRPVALGETFVPADGARARFGHAGHMLGGAWAAVELGGRSLVFSGDLGPPGKTLQRDPEIPPAADLVVLESTYGGRERPAETEESRRDKLAAEVVDAHRAGGSLLIPAFAVERTQELIHDLLVLARASRIPPMPIYLDSPLARRATEVFERHAAELEPVPDDGAAFRAAHLRAVETVAESKALARVKSGAILIAGSGMCEAGRIKHHLKEHLWRPRATVLFVGYQAPGTL
jgi:metallo-beta-lactamase family protein